MLTGAEKVSGTTKLKVFFGNFKAVTRFSHYTHTLLDFFDLIAEGEIEFEIFFYLFDAVHNGGVIFYTNFSGDFIGTEV